MSNEILNDVGNQGTSAPPEIAEISEEEARLALLRAGAPEGADSTEEATH